MRVLGINGGNGVILHPFRDYLIGNIENRSVFHTKGDFQWELNFDCPLYKKVKVDNLPDIPGVDVIISHPDCGHSSIMAYSRAKKMSDPKDNESVDMFFKGLEKYNPKVFLMENLIKFIEGYGEDGLIDILSGYNLVFHKGSVSMFGNSQITRERLVIVGIRKDLPSFIRTIFSNIYKVNQLSNAGMLIKGLKNEDESICNIRECIDDVITLYAGYKDVLSNIQSEWNNKRVEDNRWKVEGKKFTTAPGVYKNREFEPPMTVRPSNRQFNHWGLMMGPRELARLMGIPDDFNLYCDTNNKKYSINKGRVTVGKTPPYEIGLWFFKQMMKVKKYL